LYIGYNDADEYAYQLIFSTEHLDRVRFDNMDKKWDVLSKPHHFHSRYNTKAYYNPMTGTPLEDIPFLVQLIQSGDLKQKDFVFTPL